MPAVFACQCGKQTKCSANTTENGIRFKNDKISLKFVLLSKTWQRYLKHQQTLFLMPFTNSHTHTQTETHPHTHKLTHPHTQKEVKWMSGGRLWADRPHTHPVICSLNWEHLLLLSYRTQVMCQVQQLTTPCSSYWRLTVVSVNLNCSF